MIRIGKKIEGEKYNKRISSYAIIEREQDNKIAIATANGDFFFLGGGLEGKETHEEALRRELIEEAGYSIKNIQYLNTITAWADGGDRGSLDVIASFYIAKFDRKITDPIEKDHQVLWINAKDYTDKLYHEYQRYILMEYIKIKGRN